MYWGQSWYGQLIGGLPSLLISAYHLQKAEQRRGLIRELSSSQYIDDTLLNSAAKLRTSFGGCDQVQCNIENLWKREINECNKCPFCLEIRLPELAQLCEWYRGCVVRMVFGIDFPS